MNQEYVVPQDLLARCVGKTELVQRVLHAFIRQIDEDIPRLSSGIRGGNYEDAARTAHRIKGSSANVAADRIRFHAERIEQLALDGKYQEVFVVLEQLRDDRNEFVDLTATFLT